MYRLFPSGLPPLRLAGSAPAQNQRRRQPWLLMALLIAAVASWFIFQPEEHAKTASATTATISHRPQAGISYRLLHFQHAKVRVGTRNFPGTILTYGTGGPVLQTGTITVPRYALKYVKGYQSNTFKILQLAPDGTPARIYWNPAHTEPDTRPEPTVALTKLR
jgi:hypothetical protein